MSGSEHDAGDPHVGTTRGKYRVDGRLGAGSAGALYAATELGSERRVVLEILPAEIARDEDASRRLVQEASALALVAHENVVRCEGVDRDADGAPFLIFERLDGRTLEELLALEKRLPIARALRIVAQAGAGLADAHKRGIVHRDLAPSSIFLAHTADGRDAVKVGGFGLGAPLSGGTEPPPDARHYASPERLARSKTVDARTDVYSLGAILHRALAGRPPFESSDPKRLVEMIAESELPDLRALRPDVPARLADVIARACAKRAQDRYPKASALVRELEAITADVGGAPRLGEPRRGADPVATGEGAPAPRAGKHHDGGGMILTEPRARPAAPATPSSSGSLPRVAAGGGARDHGALALIALLLAGTSGLVGYAIGESAGAARGEEEIEEALEVEDPPPDPLADALEPPVAAVDPPAIAAPPEPEAATEPELEPEPAAEPEPEPEPIARVEPPVEVEPVRTIELPPEPMPDAPREDPPEARAVDPRPEVVPAAAVIAAAPPSAPGALPARPCIGAWRFRDARGAYRIELHTPERAGACGSATFEPQSATFFGSCSGTITECGTTASGAVAITFARDDGTGACVFPREWQLECAGDGASAHLGPRRGSVRLQRARR